MKSQKVPVYSHMNETEQEVAECVERHGMRPFELFESLGLFNYGGGGFHCVHVNQDEMEIMARRGLYAVSCPASNLKLASGVAPITTLMERGIPVAIGTDGPASNNCLDMFREMFLITGLQKLSQGAEAMDGRKVLKMACSTGALAMGLTDCDALAPGKQADIVMLDMHQPNMQPINNVLKNVVYSGSKQNVMMTMIAGRVCYEKGEFSTAGDIERIYYEANRIIRGME